MVQNRPKARWLVPFSVLTLLLMASLACASQSNNVKGFDLQRSYTLKSGETRSGDQVVLAYDIRLSPDSVIDGNATLTGNSVTVGAEVNGDVVVVADNVSVGDTAHVTGDLIVCSKNFEQNPAARIDGEVKEECTNSGSVSFSNTVESGWDAWRGSILFRVSSAIAGALLFGALAALGTVLVPQPLVRMSESVQRSPWRAGGIGFLTMLVAIGLTVVYSISLLLILPVILLPFVIVGWMIVALFSLLGWVALAQPFGVFLVRRLGMDHQPRMVSAALGGITLVLLLRVWSIFWFTAWIGILATIILGSVGLGAVLLTHVGTQPYPRPRLAAD
jgi:cytoskeletal protein CcmA (bactofilin family)